MCVGWMVYAYAGILKTADKTDCHTVCGILLYSTVCGILLKSTLCGILLYNSVCGISMVYNDAGRFVIIVYVIFTLSATA